MRKPNLSLGILVRLVSVLVGGLLLHPGSADAGYLPQGSIDNGDTSFNQEFAVKKVPAPFGLRGVLTPDPGSLALLGLGALLVAVGYKRRRS